MPPKRKIGGEMAASKPAAAAAKKKAYGMAPVMPAGETLTDFNKKQWVLGKSFASGGFGRIYYAKPADSPKNAKESYVIKMEPAENGPLFQEFHVYTRIGKTDMIERYKNSKGLKFLGVPAFFGCGLHKKDGMSHRFLVLPRLGTDLEKIRESQPNKRFSNVSDVARIALSCLDAYEYLHTNHTVHADLKGENLLLAPDCSSSCPANLHKCYLVDYGLARKVAEHPVYKEQPKKAHDGTLIFTSLDAHKGCAPVYRGDVEILGYNLIFWLQGSLPWSNTTKPELVLTAKASFAADAKKSLRKIFGENCAFINNLSEFFDVCYSTDYAHRPDYAKLRQSLQAILKLPQLSNAGGKLSSSSSSPRRTRNGFRQRESKNTGESFGTAGSSTAQSSSAEDLNRTDVDLFDPPPPKPSSSKIIPQFRRPPLRKAAPVSFETEDETEEDGDDDSERIVVAARPKPAPTFKIPATPPRRSIVPGAVNLDRKCRGKATAAAAVAPSPLKPFRRRESVEAALVKKYRRFQANSGKKSVPFGVEYSTAEETDDDSSSSEQQTVLRTKNVETQTSPAISDKWFASRQQKQGR